VKAYHLDLEGMKGGKDRFESDALVQVLINAVLVQVEVLGILKTKNWWWVRVLPPPGTLIWRLPGFIRPRCTAGATHRFAESYYGFKLHFSKIPRQQRNVTTERVSRQILVLKSGSYGTSYKAKRPF
jgi:hypothetical protein